jgi:hypothetical protein
MGNVRQTAKVHIKLTTMKKAAIILLLEEHPQSSLTHVSRVSLGSLLLGARTNDSQDTPTFLQWHFVKKKAVIS